MDDFTLQALFLLFISSATFLLYYIQRGWTRTPSTTKPPSPPKLPIIGHLHLLTSMPHHSFAKLSLKHGPIISLQLGQIPTLLISSPKLAKLILKTHDNIFSNRPQLVAAQYLSFNCSDVTFSTFGPYWRQVRKICVTELLSPKQVSTFHLIRFQEVDNLTQRVKLKSGCEVNMSEAFFNLANDILCRVAFGRRFVEERKKGDLVSVLTETQALLGGFCVGDFFPEWEWVNYVSGMRGRLMRNLEDLRGVCDEIINDHVEKRKGGGVEGKEDFVDVLLRVQQRDDLEVPITDDNLKALVLDMFVAGTDTTAATLEWIMTELARHPTVMKTAQDEVRKIAGNEGEVEEIHLQHLHYLKAIIKETMRLHPPVPLLVPRESMEKCTLEGYEIPAKTRILINTYAIGRDRHSWENPLEYNPDRFIDSDIDFRGQDFRFLPFGGGRRGCPGFSFGLATVEITLARLLYHFNWELPRGLGPDDVDLSEIFGLATRKKMPLVLVPTTNKAYEFNGAEEQQCALII